MRHQIAFLGSLALAENYFAIFELFDFADRSKNDERVGREFLEVRRLPEQKNLVHKFHPHFCKDCLDELLLWNPQAVNIVSCGLQVLAVFAQNLLRVNHLFLDR